MIRLCCAILSGVLLWASFPPLDGGRWLIWLALVPLLGALWSPVMIRGEVPGSAAWRPVRGREAFSWGWVAGYVFFLLNLKWLRTVTWPGMLVLPAYLALFVALWALFAATVGRPRHEWTMGSWWRAIGLTSAAWTGLEWLRGWLFTGFGWNGLGVALHHTSWVPQWAELVGATGLSFFIVVVNGWLALWFRAWRRWHTGEAAGADWAFPVKMSALFTLGGAGLLGGGAWLERRAEAMPQRPLEVALVQPNIPQVIKNDPEEFYPIATTLAELTMRALEAEPRPTVVVWPESSLPATRSDPAVISLLEEGQKLGAFTHVLGIDDQEIDAFYNAVVVFRGDPATATIYQKQHLVPFGEYVPLEAFMEKLRWMIPELPQGSFNAGDSSEPITLPTPDEDVQMIPLVCFEDTLGRVARRGVRAAPQVMINVTNDGWFLDSEAIDQHMANAVFRCIELRRPLARAANTGVTAVVDVRGRTTHALPRLEEAMLRARVMVPAGGPGEGSVPVVTFYARFGDVFSLLALATSVGGTGWYGWRRRQA